MSVREVIRREKLVAIIRLEDDDIIEPIVSHLYKGGIRVVEVTMNTPGAVEAIRKIKETYTEMTVGAGTVLDAAAAEEAIQAGADFLLAPTLKKETIHTGVDYGIPVIPGVMTPTEALTAYEWGAPLVKVFPARHLGPDFLNDLRGPLTEIEGMAVGGVSTDNMAEYLRKGWNSLGIGGSLVNKAWIQEGNFAKIEAKAKEFVAIRDNVTMV
ncbi:bifunctional 4-hydroxy-2-oxoglutarate aldolase/2-dehydro-3-deoxy-phosphogluconate aldolase [Thalassobacillus sp. CUG 92003]|uniref:bifunctional 4-hydroxy-2-oxoglutarate aldolase/2-dehydro-3-deoxy-phosphogluconate aldolase n=1 Tax=Thalassobacillus sp. CUG 92003 TaxID=2736641 RepID=UPI0015E7C9B6|nr:bifunctional 4-hydroxy-2-oxoglutarate aldolase/2-dehydro-3-deoxy-phosphogluconate aldolase [Thalassobacillus sp. CUG 92003]